MLAPLARWWVSGHYNHRVLMVNLWGGKWKGILGTEQLAGWENTRTAASAPIHLPLLIAAGLIIFHLSGQEIHGSYYN